MLKSELRDDFKTDFKKVQGALTEILEHNRKIDQNLVADLIENDFKRLEEHLEISKLILDATKSFNDVYANAPKIMDAIESMNDTEKDSKNKTSLKDIMGDLD